MILLILGVLLWSGAHFFKRALPDQRLAMQEKMGDGSKGVVAGLLLLSIILMVIGYRSYTGEVYWTRSTLTVGLNNILMLVSVALFGLGSSKSRLRGHIRHPMLLGFCVWAASHLLVNGDTASFILWIGLILWAAVTMLIINLSEPDETAFEGGSVAGDVRLFIISLVVYAVIAAIHIALGYNPFGG